MALNFGFESAGGVPAVKTLYDSTLEAYLAAQDARVLKARRNRWLVLIVGLSLSAAVLAWAIRSTSDNEFGPMVAFGLAVGPTGCPVKQAASRWT